MKSIKPGRGPSMLGGIVGIAMIGFGILWTILASRISGIFALFGVIWTGIAIAISNWNSGNQLCFGSLISPTIADFSSRF